MFVYVLAALGAILGVANGAVNLWRFSADKRDLRMRIAFATPMTIQGVGPYYKSSSDPEIGNLIVIEAFNAGRRPVTVTEAGVGFYQNCIPGLRSTKLECGFTLGLDQLPKKLEEHDPNIALLVTKNDLLDGIRNGIEGGLKRCPDQFRRITAPDHFWVRDSSGKRHRRRLPRQTQRWLKANLTQSVE